MVCRFTKYVVAIPLRTATSDEIARDFVNYWILKFGTPEKVLSDRGANLYIAQSEIMKGVYAILGIKKLCSNPVYLFLRNGLTIPILVCNE